MMDFGDKVEYKNKRGVIVECGDFASSVYIEHRGIELVSNDDLVPLNEGLSIEEMRLYQEYHVRHTRNQQSELHN